MLAKLRLRQHTHATAHACSACQGPPPHKPCNLRMAECAPLLKGAGADGRQRYQALPLPPPAPPAAAGLRCNAPTRVAARTVMQPFWQRRPCISAAGPRCYDVALQPSSRRASRPHHCRRQRRAGGNRRLRDGGRRQPSVGRSWMSQPVAVWKRVEGQHGQEAGRGGGRLVPPSMRRPAPRWACSCGPRARFRCLGPFAGSAAV